MRLIREYLYEDEEKDSDDDMAPEEELKKDLEDIDKSDRYKKDLNSAYDKYYELSQNQEYKNIDHKIPQKVKDFFIDVLKIPESELPEDNNTFAKLEKEHGNDITLRMNKIKAGLMS